MAIKKASPALRWLVDMMDFMSRDSIKVPSDYRPQVLEVKALLKQDPSGLASTLLDLAISSAADVDYRIETSNDSLDDLLNSWLGDINFALRGKIPTGIENLSKEYYRERWKGSSFLLLRTFWEDVGGYNLPTKLYFLDGEDIVVSDNKQSVILGDEKYKLRISKNKSIALPSRKNEVIFIQKPYDSWGTSYSTPFLIQRGIFENVKFLELLGKKGQDVVGKALEYLLTMKKGTEGLFLEGHIGYSADELAIAKEDFQKIISDRKTQAGTPSYVSNFDTEIEHLIPEYKKILDGVLYAPIEKRILAGIGLVDIVQGAASTRRESTLNPKPFIGEINSGVSDFKSLLKDIMLTMVERNKNKHPKYFKNTQIEKIRTTSLKIFLSDDDKVMFRSMYDRGAISKQTFVEMTGDVDYTLEVERRKAEKTRGEEKTMFPPVTQNLEQNSNVKDFPDTKTKDVNDNEVPDDRTGPETKNFSGVLEETKCPHCSEIFDYESQKEITVGSVACPKCQKEVTKASILELAKKKYEEAPYTLKKYPAQLKNIPAKAREIWIKTFNEVLKQTNSETTARQSAWRNVKLKYKKVEDKWTRKTKSEVEKSVKELDIEKLVDLAKLEILGKQNKLLDQIIKENEVSDSSEVE